MLPRMPTRSGNSTIVEDLVAVGERRAGSDAERRAAGALAERLRTQGRQARLEAIYVYPQQATIGLIHCVLGVAASLLATAVPAGGFALALLAATSLYLDRTGRAYLLRRLLFRRGSQNVVATPPAAESEGPLVLLCANLDAPQSGAAYNPGYLRGLETLRRLLPGRWGPFGLVFWSIALLLPPLAVRMAGVDSDAVAALQLPQTLALILAAFLLGEIALSRPSPGANCNASGVASALAAARELAADPPERLAVGVLLTGGGEAGQGGVRSFLRRHRKGLTRETTLLISFEGTGRGAPVVPLAGTGPLAQPYDPELVELASALAEESGGEVSTVPDAAPGDAYMAATRGWRALALSARERPSFHPPGYGSAGDLPATFAEDSVSAVAGLGVSVVRLLDRQLGRRDRDAG
jgi:hypothetical protein